jgi:phage terminase large subunit-like protein
LTTEERATRVTRGSDGSYDGVYQSEIDGALWTFESIEHARCTPDDVPADLKRVVVAIDPSGTAGDEDKRSGNVGIIVAGKSMDNIGYVLADRTCNLPPEGWARVAVTAYREFKADRIVAERNFGGDMVARCCARSTRISRFSLSPLRAARLCEPSRSRHSMATSATVSGTRTRSGRPLTRQG